MDLDQKVEALTKSITDLASEMRDKADLPLDRVTAIEEEIAAKSAALDDLQAEKREREIDAKLAQLEDRVKSFTRDAARTKTAAILAGVVDRDPTVKSVGKYSETNFLSALVARRFGDTDAQEFVKAVLGTSTATGQAIVPGNFVSELVTQLALTNIYRGLFEVTSGVQGAGVNIPYETTAISAANMPYSRRSCPSSLRTRPRAIARRRCISSPPSGRDF